MVGARSKSGYVETFDVIVQKAADDLEQKEFTVTVDPDGLQIQEKIKEQKKEIK